MTARFALAAVVGGLLLGARRGAAQDATYTPVAGRDWREFQTTADLRAAVRFFTFDRSRRANDFVDLEPDETFGRVARITQPADNDPQSRGGFSPELRVRIQPALEDVWFRFRVRFSPGWTTAGPYPRGWANSYKLAFLLWEGLDGRAEIQFSNTRQYILGAYVQGGHCQSRPLPGNTDFGVVTTEWTDGGWWEFVMHYARTGPRTFTQEWWRRRLPRGSTTGGAFTYRGMTVACDVAPTVRGIALGVNKNKATPTTQYIFWGPWEVVDGERFPNPFNLPNVR